MTNAAPLLLSRLSFRFSNIDPVDTPDTMITSVVVPGNNSFDDAPTAIYLNNF